MDNTSERVKTEAIICFKHSRVYFLGGYWLNTNFTKDNCKNSLYFDFSENFCDECKKEDLCVAKQNSFSVYSIKDLKLELMDYGEMEI